MAEYDPVATIEQMLSETEASNPIRRRIREVGATDAWWDAGDVVYFSNKRIGVIIDIVRVQSFLDPNLLETMLLIQWLSDRTHDLIDVNSPSITLAKYKIKELREIIKEAQHTMNLLEKGAGLAAVLMEQHPVTKEKQKQQEKIKAGAKVIQEKFPWIKNKS